MRTVWEGALNKYTPVIRLKHMELQNLYLYSTQQRSIHAIEGDTAPQNCKTHQVQTLCAEGLPLNSIVILIVLTQL